MLTVKEWLEESGSDFVNEVFLPVFEEGFDNLHGPFLKCVAYRGKQSGQLLHPDFGNILESI